MVKIYLMDAAWGWVDETVGASASVGCSSTVAFGYLEKNIVNRRAEKTGWIAREREARV
jgi:hypothetical protein